MRGLAAIAASGLLALSGPALAQDAQQAPVGVSADELVNNSAFGDWIFTCEAITVRRTVCRLVQELTLRDGGQLVARFIATPVEDGRILLAQVPMGVYLPAGAVYRFAERDDLEQREMIWQRCLGQICEAAIPLDDDEMAIFAETSDILFGFRMDPSEEPVVVSVDISRFAEAMRLLEEVQ
ncbi:MAG: invasion associated locus B family protein [Rhodobacteraceae bacterium]|nr:invasion associated locus B family protein [Paracoccaceae bacterium]